MHTLKFSRRASQLCSSGALLLLAQSLLQAAPQVQVSALKPALTLPDSSVTLMGTMTNAIGTVANTWSEVSGPAGAPITFSNPNSVQTTVSFLTAGSYVLRLTSQDTMGSSSSDMQIQVYPAGTAGGALMVEAGSTLNCWMSDPTVQLNGAYWNTPMFAKFRWSQVSGPGTVMFASAFQRSTKATFSVPGVYVLKLDVTAGQASGSDTMVVEVYDETKNFPYAPNGSSTVAPQNFGYIPTVLSQIAGLTSETIPQTTSAFLNKYFKYELNTQYDFKDIDMSRLKAPPAAGVHPRILFNPEDLGPLTNNTDTKSLRYRLAHTAIGQLEMTAIKTMLTKTLTGPSATDGAIYTDLSNGDLTSFDAGNKSSVVDAICYEAFRALIEGDIPGGTKAGAALATVASESLAAMQASPTNAWQGHNDGQVYYQAIGFAYDFAYNFMSITQQNTVRQTLAAATAGAWNVGMDALPSVSANTSNWIPNETMYLTVSLMAIEGEPGYDPDVMARVKGAWDRFYTFGVTSDGAYYEGMAKGQLNSEALVALAKRGDMLIASVNAKNHMRQFYLNSMETTGYGFTWDELNAQSLGDSKQADPSAFKYAFPTDPVIDFIYRNHLGKAGKGTTYNSEGFTLVNLGFFLQAMDNLINAVFASDYDKTKTWDQAAAAIAPTVPNTYFANNRGLLITRAAKDTASTSTARDAEALRLFFQPRSQPGGHGEPNRNLFAFSALGTIWAPMYVNEATASAGVTTEDTARTSSLVLIDNVGPSSVPASVVDFSDSDLFTYATGDAKNAYSKIISGNKNIGTPYNYTFKDTRFFDGGEPWENLPYGALPAWYSSNYGPASKNGNDHNGNYFWTNYHPVQRAFRTAGLVRGATPYALIVDDIQMDNANHAYTWRMMLNGGVSAAIGTNGTDVTLSSGTDRLLVRLIGHSGTATFKTTSIPWYNGGSKIALDINITTVHPDFKVMLVPYASTGTPPATSVNGNVVTLTAGTQTDTIAFSSDAAGRSHVTVTRVSP